MMTTLFRHQFLQFDARSGPVLLPFRRVFIASLMSTLFLQPLPLVFSRPQTVPLPSQLHQPEFTTYGQP